MQHLCFLGLGIFALPRAHGTSLAPYDDADVVLTNGSTVFAVLPSK